MKTTATITMKTLGWVNRRSIRLLSVWLFLLWAGLGAQAQTFSYTSQQPLPGVGNGGAAYGNGVYVMVSGGGGYIYRSVDGQNWSVATNTAFINTNYTSVCFAQGLFVACTASGAIVTSTNGLNWAIQNSGTTQYLTGSVYLNGRYFVTGEGGIILSSTNATNWVSQALAGSTYHFYSLTYGNGKYLMSAYDASLPDAYAYYFSSTTGTNDWTSGQIGGGTNGNYNFIGYLNNKFYTVFSNSHIYTSPDGSTWTQFTGSPIAFTPYQMFGGTYINGTYYFFGFDSKSYGAIFSSTNGTNFVELPKGFSDQVINLAYGNGVFISVDNASFYYSTNGATNWVGCSGGSYNSVACNGTNYVAVGAAGASSDGYIAVSPDYVNWTNVTPAWTPACNGVTYGNGKFVAVTGQEAPFTNSLILSSTNGINWSSTNSGSSDNFWSVATDGNGTFVAAGDNGDILRSVNNGATWAIVTTSATNGLQFVAYLNSQFVASGYGGVVMYSANGSSWANAFYSDMGSQLTGIAYGNGMYIAAGYDGNYNELYLTRPSLSSGSWAVPSSPPPAIPAESDQTTMNYGNGVFLSFYDDTNYNGYLFTSTNGQIWTQHDLGNTNGESPYIYGGTFANSAFHLVGWYDYTATATVTFSQPPGITSATSTNATYGSPFSYTITASNSPTSFGAGGLPSGLSVNTASGVISGTPTQSGAYAATIAATNAAGSGTAALAITVAKASTTVSGLVATNKVFNGTTTATLNFADASVNGVVNSDSISLNNTGYTANFSTTNAGINLAVTVSGLTLAGTEATNYTLTQPAGLTADITPAPASVTLNRSVQLYSGSAESVTATTAPTGLPVSLTYNGSTTAPASVGNYTVIGTVTNPNYSGSATNFLSVAVAPQILTVRGIGNTNLMFTWSALATVNYQVQYTLSLQPVSWIDWNGPVSATNATMTTYDVINTDQLMHLYRVQLLLQ